MGARSVTALFAAVVAMVVASTGAAFAATKCTAAVTKEAAKLVQARTKILQLCEESVLKGKAGFSSPAGAVCSDTDGKTADKIADVAAKFQAAVRKACCGKDATCGTLDDAFGAFGLGHCPQSDGPTAPAGSCTGLVGDAGDAAACLGCLLGEQSQETVEVTYGAFHAGPKGSALQKCQAAAGKATMAFALAKSKILANCQATVLKGKISVCPDAEKAAPAIEAVRAKMATTICKACGGEDKECGGDPDQTIADIGAPAACPPLLAGGAPGAAILDLPSLAGCLASSAGDHAACSDAFGASTTSTLPVQCSVPALCSPSGGTTTAAVKFETASGVDLAGLIVAVGYRDALFPGIGEIPIPSARVTTPQAGSVAAGNNLRGSLLFSIASLGLTPGTLFNVQFDNCGAPPTDGDFTCLVVDAADPNGEALDKGARCFVDVP